MEKLSIKTSPDYTEIYQCITFLRFPATLLVVILHAYTTARYLNLEDADSYLHISYVLSLCVGEMGVPLFFTISGFLFYNNYNNIYNYVPKLKNRIHSLFIPYLFWNTFMILTYWILQSIPQLSSYFSGNNLPIADYDIINFIRAFWDCGNWDKGNGLPILQPYWYIRNLMILSLCSPILFFYIKYLKWIGILIPACCWIYAPHLAFSLSSITFFSLGALFSIHHINIAPFLKAKQKIFIFIFAISITAEYICHFYIPTPYNPYLHRIVLITGIPFLTSTALLLKDRFTIPPLFTNSSFLIYTVHLPIVIALRKGGAKLFPNASDGINILLYAGTIVLTVIICITLYYILNKYVPKITRIITGR